MTRPAFIATSEGSERRAAADRAASRVLLRVVIVLLCLGGLVLFGVASSEADETVTGFGGGSSMSFAFPTGQPAVAVAPHPAAIEASRLKFARLGGKAAVEVAERTFHVEAPSVAMPGSEPGSSLGRYVGNDAVEERLPGGGRVLTAATFPLRVSTPSGLEPTSFALKSDGEAFVPSNPIVPIAIGERAAEGVAFENGIAVTPVGADGAEAPVLTGDKVVFPNAGRDVDLMAGARPDGAEISWLLRSEESSPDESLRFHLPAGLALRESQRFPGGVEVVEGGEGKLFVPPAVAVDAAGNSVPVSYSVSGDILTVHVVLTSSVEYPVLVDPYIALGAYGVDNGSSQWSGWEMASNWAAPNPPNGFRPGVFANTLIYETGTGSAPSGAYADMSIRAPGTFGLTESAGIFRVDLVGVKAMHKGESRLDGRMSYSTGSEPTWTFNPELGKQGIDPLIYEYDSTGFPVSFCAQNGTSGAGLCAEGFHAGYFELLDELTSTSLTKEDFVSIEGALVSYWDGYAPKTATLSHPGYEAGTWLKKAPSNFAVEAEDAGLGVREVIVHLPGGKLANNFGCEAENGFHGCPPSVSSTINFAGWEAESARTGIFTLEPSSVDAAANGRNGSPVELDLDQAAPTISPFTGSLGAAAGGVVGSGNYTLNYETNDGTHDVPQSGVRKVEIKVDGKAVSTSTSSCSEPHGAPAEACEQLNSNWTMSGESVGAGTHTITAVATDWVGNTAERSITVTVNEAAGTAAGPGTVNLQTGDFKLNPTDAAIAAGPAQLAVSRTFDSRNLTQGATGPLGPQWQLSLLDSATVGEWQSLKVEPNGAVAVSDAHGEKLTFAPSGNNYTSPPGYQTDTLTKVSSTEYTLTDSQGDYTTFKPNEQQLFVPVTVAQATAAGGLNKVTYKFTTKEGITEPTQVLGPEPSTGACTSELVKGCRALTFVYSGTTEAESGSEWGQYKGRLWKVEFTAWEPSESKMKTTPVAQYAYDSEGRLRQEWDPRISPALKTTYGYDAEGHVTAVSPPGQQPWLIHYGTTAADAKPGRTLSVARFNAETTLWSGEKLKNTAAPTLSTSSPVVGTRMSVTNGSWNATAVYGYQWERCSATGTECAPIAGAVNQTYTPVVADFGHTLAAQVTGTDAWGSITIQTAVSSKVAYTHAAWASSFGSLGSGAGQVNGPTGPALTSDGKLWVADSANRRIDEFSSSGSFIETIGWGVKNGKSELQTCTSSCQQGIWGAGAGQLEDPEGIAVNQSNGWLYVADGEDNLIQEYNPTGSQEGGAYSVRSFGGTGSGEGKLNGPKGIALDAANDLWVADYANNRIEEFNSNGGYVKTLGKLGSGHGEYKGPSAVIIVGGNLYVTDSGNGRVQELTTTGEWEREIGTKGSGEGQLEYPWGLAYDPLNEDIYVNSYSANKIEAFTLTGTYLEQFGGYGTGKEQFHGPSGIAVTSSGSIEIADEYNERIDVWAPTGVISEEPTQPAPNPGTTSVATFEYNLPLSGTGLPNLSEAETTKWAQKDKPVEGTAVFPGDEPQSWPAGSYKRASIYYLDSANRTVNTASPTGAITTTEYDAKNDNVERTLTPDNREKALKEANTKEAAEHLSTVNEYSSDGTELLSTLGPEHQVKITAAGSTIAARKHVRYFYDEGAPGTGGPYRLVTKTVEGAKPINGAENEQDIRSVTTRYSGQENLGWKLHTPTETETSTGTGQTLKTTTQYDATTGQVSESAKTTPTPTVNEYGLPTGSQPYGITAGPDNNVWFTDYGTGKVGKITTTGTISEYKAEPDGPEGITTGPDGNLWFVEHAVRHVNSITPSGTLSVHTLTRTSTYNTGITAGPDGNLWFTEQTAGYIGKMNTKGEVLAEYELPAGSEPTAITSGPDGNLWFTNTKTNKVGKITPTGTKTEYTLGLSPDAIVAGPDGNMWVVEKFGKLVKLSTAGETLGEYAFAQNAEATGITVGLDGNLYLAYSGTAKIAAFSTAGSVLHEYALPAGSKPQQIAGGPDGNIWFTDYGTNKIGKITLGDLGNSGAKNTQTTYYTKAANENHPACGNHAEWTGLPCEAGPAAQPGITGAPKLATTTYTYNIWDEPTTTTDKIATTPETTRTTTVTYDNAGRVKSTAVEATNTSDLTVPSVTDEYNSATGALKKQSQTSEGESQNVTSEENTLGELTSYTDSTGNKATYEYEKEKDSRLLKLRDAEGASGASTDTYGYDTTTGFVASLKDEAAHGAGTFTAKYDVEGNLTSEGLPNGVTEKYALDATGQTTGLEYVKGSTVWYSDTATPSIHQQLLTQATTLAKDNYTYDETGRLTEAQETPSGEGCTSRLYAYDEDGNRSSLTTRAPGAEGKCATEGGTSQPYTYDTADRQLAAGLSYEAFGNITSLPASYAGGNTLTSTYTVANQLATQEQNSEKRSYTYDPAGRVRTIAAISTETDHYENENGAPAWTAIGAGNWVRNIAGIQGALVGTEENGATPKLQLADLDGNIIGTAKDSETETKLETTSQTNEYGVPRSSIAGRYAWRGAEQQPTEFPTGIIAMGARTYIPQLGRFEQEDPQPGGSINRYAFAANDPISQTDPTGEEWTYVPENELPGEAPGSRPETFIAPGAITPAEVEEQVEAAIAAHPAVSARSVLQATTVFAHMIYDGGSGHRCPHKHCRREEKLKAEEAKHKHTCPSGYIYLPWPIEKCATIDFPPIPPPIPPGPILETE